MSAERKRIPGRKGKRNNGGGLTTALSSSRIFKDYEEAFTKASGLPLILREPHARKDSPAWPNHNAFCAMMARNNHTCAACYELQCRLEKEAVAKPCTLKCFAGLCETAVPVRVGSEVVAFLETGHVFLRKPRNAGFNRVTRAVLASGADIDLKQAEEAWLSTRIITPDQYQGFVHLLAIFARHLEMCGNALALENTGKDRGVVQQAKTFILAHSADDLSLKAVAEAVNLSAHYFCKKFKEGTGMAFTEYVARVRVERARQLLGDPALRISEVAFKSGFQSVSQFNRAFNRFAGRSPSSLRREMGLNL